MTPRQRRGPYSETPLQRFLDARGIPSARLEAKLQERLEYRAPDQKQVHRWRLGRAEPRRKHMVRLLWAMREVANDASIRMEDIIDLDPENPANWDD